MSVKGQPIVNGELFAEVLHEEIMWQVEDGGKLLVITLEKTKDAWWTQLLTTDPEIDIKIPEEYNSAGYREEPAEILNEKNMASYLASHGF